ncbi:L-threonylcarbamoyladenylate synthase [Desulforhopalus singaporensis]|uniref:L-threonylcarbamoyladenylate synthase n=1 Tax=Desulforhopalus singaporensis TaxID=91360 RepID=A0A1H0PYS4_9BACT|nr:L-threonylcarbamoyladenylate synthase [Desulforhopalus singaporensis]SDP09569.1 translation factor SUA5 [Desulforhopalus singaporensis]
MSRSDHQLKSRIGRSVSLAAEYLRQGKVVAFPTETSYGLAVDPCNDRAVERLFSLKKRSADKPILLLVQRCQQLNQLVSTIPDGYRDLMSRYWPGPLTLIFPALDCVNPKLTANTKTVGIRISPHPVARSLLAHFGAPVTATSANLSGMEAAASAEEVLTVFGDAVDYILEGIVSAGPVWSTIVTTKNGRLAVIRQGELKIDDQLLPDDGSN